MMIFTTLLSLSAFLDYGTVTKVINCSWKFLRASQLGSDDSFQLWNFGFFLLFFRSDGFGGYQPR